MAKVIPSTNFRHFSPNDQRSIWGQQKKWKLSTCRRIFRQIAILSKDSGLFWGICVDIQGVAVDNIVEEITERFNLTHWWTMDKIVETFCKDSGKHFGKSVQFLLDGFDDGLWWKRNGVPALRKNPRNNDLGGNGRNWEYPWITVWFFLQSLAGVHQICLGEFSCTSE